MNTRGLIPHRMAGDLLMGAFVVTLLGGCGVKYDRDKIVTPSSAGLSAVANPHVVAADGASVVEIRVSAAIPTATSVTVTTTAGTLVGGTATVAFNDQRQAVALLQAPVAIGTAVIRVTMGNVVAQDTVRFERSFPERIDVEANPFSVKSAQAQSVISMLPRRAVGSITAGLIPVVVASDSLDNPIGQFGIVQPSGSGGAFSVPFFVPPSTYVGRILIRASVSSGAAGETVRDSTFIYVTN